MPLRDHFRSPLDDKRSWDGLYAMWPAVMVQQLVKSLPPRYFAMPGVYLGSLFEVDIGTFGETDSEVFESEPGEGGVALAYAPPKPTTTFEAELPNQDVYEVRICDAHRKRKLVAAVEIISPSNKDRPDRRGDFVTKVASLLKNGICVSIVNVVTLRARYERRRKLIDTWHHPLEIGQPLPALPIWLTENSAVELDLASTYEDSCRTLRII